MQSVCLKDFVQYFPSVPQEYAQKIYTQPFRPEDILYLFEGWEYYENCDCYIDDSEERNILRFEELLYTINAEKIQIPTYVDDFIRDCRERGVRLLWSEQMADKLWFKPSVNVRSN